MALQGVDSRLIIVVLLAQSLIVFDATRTGLLNPTTLIWPTVVEIWPTIMVLAMGGVVTLCSFGTSLQVTLT
jgi:hypothetical protein